MSANLFLMTIAPMTLVNEPFSTGTFTSFSAVRPYRGSDEKLRNRDVSPSVNCTLVAYDIPTRIQVPTRVEPREA